MRLVMYSAEYPLRINYEMSDTHTFMTSVPEEDDMEDHDYVPKQSLTPHLIKQSELNDLRRELKLSKNDSEILGSRLQQ